MNPLYFLVLSSARISPQAQTPKDEVAIIHARINIGNGEVIDDGTVWVKAGRIVAVGKSVTVPENVSKVDAKGKTLYPGFIDAFSTNAVKSPPDASPEGKPDVTSSAPPTMWIGNRKGISGDFDAAKNLDLDPDEDYYKAGITTVFAVPGRGSIRGKGVIVNLLPATNKTRVAFPNVGMGMGFRNGTGAGYPSDILGVIALMRQTLTDAQSLSKGARFDIKGDKKPSWMGSIEALVPVVQGSMPVVFEAAIEREIMRAVRISEDFGFKTMIAGGRDAFKVGQTLADRNIPVLLNVDYGDAPSVKPDDAKIPASSSTPVEIKQERFDRWKEQSEGVLALAKSGVRIALSAGGSQRDFLANVRQVIKTGWSAKDALYSLTLGGAKILGIDKEMGSIEEGKVANLVLMSGDFADEKSTVESVWVMGTRVLGGKEVKK